MIAAARAHEQGHVQIINDDVARLDGSVITGTGPTAAAAFANAQSQIEQGMQQLNDQIAQDSYEYDLKTSHGQNQAVVGGQNVALSCPPGT